MPARWKLDRRRRTKPIPRNLTPVRPSKRSTFRLDRDYRSAPVSIAVRDRLRFRGPRHDATAWTLRRTGVGAVADGELP
jgi:hypothetical protein